ncbi:MAG TPA: response regulator [Gammaproteobacteria bacterium]|nr:response regulator [Gammaproteobacteria bacterium]
MRILLVEDDELLGEGTRKGLAQDGYTVDWVKDGAHADEALKIEKFDLIVLDLGLPNLSGIDILQNLRERGDTTPVLILTARESIEDRIKGLDTGADDYMIKPFNLDELLARLRSLQRRFASRAAPLLEHDGIILDPASHVVTQHGDPVNLSRREFALLHILLENVGRVLSREHLTQSLYGWGEEVDSNALEVHIHNLRKRFGQSFIRTVRGVGYTIEKSKDSKE